MASHLKLVRSQASLEDLKKYPLIYLASPYSQYPDGIEAAFKEIASIAGALLKHGIRAYSPICHTHPIAMYGDIDPLDHSIWMPFDKAIMPHCNALLVARMIGWQNSRGVGEEIDDFLSRSMPIFYLNPKTLEVYR